MLHRGIRFLFLLLVPGLIAALPAPEASARLEPKVWRQVQADAERLFRSPGETEAKQAVVAQLLEDGEKRAWRLLVDALVKESGHWIKTRKAVSEKETEIDAVQSKPMAKRYPEEQANLEKWKAELATLEDAARAEKRVLAALTEGVASGPEILRRNLYGRARGSPQWSVRAAAASVAAVHVDEKDSFEFLSRTLQTDKDARVRMAAVEALRQFALEHAKPAPSEGENGGEEDEDGAPDLVSTVEGLIIGRLGDSDWGVQLVAVKFVKDHQLSAAIPHLINALAFASPRVVETIGEVLRDFTGENFDPYADVWAKWWEANREQFASNERVKAGKNKRPPSDAHFYGLPVKSDRVLFIIDTSSSMKEVTKNENPAEKWKPRGPVTRGEGPPPPPPPEEILSGPKIDVAKHELKKALLKLPPSCMFNIVAFNTAVMRWRDDMQKCTEKNRKEALTWVRTLEPKGITYVDGALRLAFKMAGIASFDRAYPDVNIDTIILLSDGAPTLDNVEKVVFQPPEEILQHVREWNRHKRIVVHCIGVDMVAGIEFLKDLAKENGGQYVDR